MLVQKGYIKSESNKGVLDNGGGRSTSGDPTLLDLSEFTSHHARGKTALAGGGGEGRGAI